MTRNPLWCDPVLPELWSGRTQPSDTSAPVIWPLRAVSRAAAELRSGFPVLLAGVETLLVIAAETADAGALARFARMVEYPLLLLAPVRAAAVLRRPVAQGISAVALRVDKAVISAETLRDLADPVRDPARLELLEVAPSPVDAPAALALAKLGSLLPAVVVSPLRPDMRQLADRSGFPIVHAEDVLSAPRVAATSLRRLAEARLPLDGAEDARVVAFREPETGTDHLAILIGQPETAEAPLVRLHSECFTGDLLGSLRCDCGSQLRGAIRRMANAGAGVLLYLAQEGRGIGLTNKLRAYALQDRGLDTLDANRALGFEADERNFQVAATMLASLGIRRLRLLTNNPDKLAALASYGVDIAGREEHSFAPNGVNDHYLATKARRFGHMLE